MHKDPIEDVIHQLHLKYNLPKGAIRAIVDSPFRCLTDSLRAKEFKNFLFVNFGKFCVSKIKHKKLEGARLKREREQKENEQKQDPPNFRGVDQQSN